MSDTKDSTIRLLQALATADAAVVEIALERRMPRSLITEVRRSLALARVGVEDVAIIDGIDLGNVTEAIKPEPERIGFRDLHLRIDLCRAQEALLRAQAGQDGDRSELRDAVDRAKLALRLAEIDRRDGRSMSDEFGIHGEVGQCCGGPVGEPA